MQLNELRRPNDLKRPAQRVGRGQSSGRGKQSGRGGKGQTARAGAKMRPEWRDIIKKLPKRRGYGKNRGRTVVGTRPEALALSLGRLDALFESGAVVSPATLAERGALGRKPRPIKIVGGGAFSKKLSVRGIPVSSSARAAIEKAGGTVE
ncbi:50S ribosomal protein L15 [Candidatus Kaiserbacteria bacterium RIFCSPHIGHO2_02_FULL_59_21]|uniref:Large ribosomal subunit protein uL15 n=2 Tax=Candidatus Kaiseribacteriota TaxID=1752734 RepID=A0A0G2BP72_9BACT|nr:MAG: 50S ribosomal protein L15 [Candidatus Kaiserbacteria bacterium GW2011_GWA2_58_9]OGG63323.1 MAG: 50S ribosomal protein L15 [Candidatus Kaiserbacteria bacterium RIFCSPHIGHO2_01_FULL_58_22]OGG66642.1 MAG: 50S ribosomal protein L15 [Candidatus Kaiserbacteria bacterium RIFCSPHIGHO2_02_FULL_59_21]OGG78983.1 MAG: 50S ribosomal protein L15 [Candidatus Kaiserbacteria bacterium RIFCSPLOWO2_01_FULL_59_34]